jgi:Carboxypeptidase regulatory-like domain
MKAVSNNYNFFDSKGVFQMGKLILVVAIYFLILLFSSTLSAQSVDSSIVKGKVVDIDENPISNAVITFVSSKNSHFETLTDTKGNYRMSVSSGNYQMKVWKKTFYESYRSQFRSDGKTELVFNFTLIFYELTEFRNGGVTGKNSSRHCFCSDLIVTERLAIKHPKQPEINEILVQHAGRTTLNEIVQFSNVGILSGDCEKVEADLDNRSFVNNRQFPIIVTYNTRTLISDKAFYNPATNVLTMEKNLFVIENGNKILAIKASIDLENDCITVKK